MDDMSNIETFNYSWGEVYLKLETVDLGVYLKVDIFNLGVSNFEWLDPEGDQPLLVWTLGGWHPNNSLRGGSTRGTVFMHSPY